MHRYTPLFLITRLLGIAGILIHLSTHTTSPAAEFFTHYSARYHSEFTNNLQTFLASSNPSLFQVEILHRWLEDLLKEHTDAPTIVTLYKPLMVSLKKARKRLSILEGEPLNRVRDYAEIIHLHSDHVAYLFHLQVVIATMQHLITAHPKKSTLIEYMRTLKKERFCVEDLTPPVGFTCPFLLPTYAEQKSRVELLLEEHALPLASHHSVQ